MRITNLRVQKNDYFTRAVASLCWEDSPIAPQEIYFEVPNQYAEWVSCNPDAFFVACSLPAMYYGEKRIYMEDPVCPSLKSDIRTALAWIYHWYQVGNPDLQLDCPVKDHVELPGKPQRTASFFTGGIDSWTNLLQNHVQYPASHPKHIKDFFMVYGLQYVKRANFERAVEQFKAVGSSLGVNFIPIYTNIYAYLIDGDVGHPFWQKAYNGAALAAAGHICYRNFDAISIASGNDIPNLIPFGSHPNLDTNYSSYNLRVSHDGLTLSRIEKTKLVAASAVALQNLRVCDMPEIPDHKQNCGECEKCVRTAITLEALDRLKDTTAFPYQQVTAEIAGMAYIKDPGIERMYRELFPLLEASNKHDVVQAIKAKIRRFHLERLDTKLCGGLIFATIRKLKALIAPRPVEVNKSQIYIDLPSIAEEG